MPVPRTRAASIRSFIERKMPRLPPGTRLIPATASPEPPAPYGVELELYLHAGALIGAATLIDASGFAVVPKTVRFEMN